MNDYGDCKGCKHLVIYEDSFGCDAQHDLCDDVCPNHEEDEEQLEWIRKWREAHESKTD